MKKISALLFLAITLPLAISAQDTVMFGDTTYHFIPHPAPVTIRNTQGHPYFFSKCSVESPRQIYGIAITGSTNGIIDTLVMGMAYKDTACFNLFYVDSIRNMTVQKVTMGFCKEQDTFYFPCYEFYFSKDPLTLSDSMFIFYHISFQSFLREDGGFFPIVLQCDDTEVREERDSNGIVYYYECPWETHIAVNTVCDPFARHVSECFLYPILTPDRPYAIPVTGLRRTGQGPDNATFVWDDMQVREWYNTTDSSAYELRLQQGDSTLRTMATGDTALRLDALTPGVLYSASVRQALHHTCLHHADSTLYGPWSSPIYFRLTGTVDIDDPAADSHAPLRLYPNPAAAETTLEADAALLPATLVITDTQGRPCHTQPLTTPTCRIPLATLPAGHYTLTLHTPSIHPSIHPSIPLIIQH